MSAPTALIIVALSIILEENINTFYDLNHNDNKRKEIILA